MPPKKHVKTKRIKSNKTKMKRKKTKNKPNIKQIGNLLRKTKNKAEKKNKTQTNWKLMAKQSGNKAENKHTGN